MAKYSLGVDDVAGLHLMCLNLSKDILSRGGDPATVEQVIDGAKAIEAYIVDKAAMDQIAADAAAARVAAEAAENLKG